MIGLAGGTIRGRPLGVCAFHLGFVAPRADVVGAELLLLGVSDADD